MIDRWQILIALAFMHGGPARAGQEALPNVGDEATHTILVGQVLDQLGSGVEGVEVSVEYSPPAADPTVIGQATSNATGDFEVHAATAPRGPARVIMRKTGYALFTLDVDLNPDEPPPFVDAQMQGALTVSGSVKDALGDHKPVSGAKVLVQSSSGQWKATTGPDGAFQIQGVEPGRGAIMVEAEGFARHRRKVEDLALGDPLEILLSPERIVTLLITNESHQPIAGAAVECVDQTGTEFRMATTDEQGRCALRGLPAATTQLSAKITHAEYVSSLGFDRTVELPSDQAESSHTLILAPAGRLAGTITDAATGRPLGGARVSVGKNPSDDMPRKWSDYDGSYSIGGLPQGAAVVTVHRSGYAPELCVAEIKAGEEARLDLRLLPGAEINGRVVEADSQKPLPGVYLMAERWRESGTLGLRAVTDHEGRYQFFDAPADAFQVTVSLEGYERIADQTLKAGEPAPPITLTPLAGAHVVAFPLSSLKTGDLAPELDVVALDGKPMKLSDWRGKTVLLDFWATWCGPCVGEIPGLLKIHEEFGGRGNFVMLGISLDADVETFQRFVAERKIVWPQVIGEQGKADVAAEAYGVTFIPAVFLIGPEGTILATGLRGMELHEAVRKAVTGGTEKPSIP